MKRLRVLFLGDIVGEPGCRIFQKHIKRIREEYKIDALVVNGENSAAQGRGITPELVHFFKQHTVDVITTGNHVWAKNDIYPYLATHTDVLRPANFPQDTPGVGVTTFNCNGQLIAIINVQGRVFMREHLACPFRTVESILTYVRSKTSLIFIDIHAEVTSEKIALATFVDGKVSGVVGTHTHVQTADERILPGGTAFITDLGMAGALYSLLGMKKEPIIQNFITQMPVRFAVETEPPFIMTGAWIEVDGETGRALAIQRVRIVDPEG